MPGWRVSLRRGIAGKCPACGEGRLFRSFLAVTPRCASCATPLGDVPADDAPPYVTIFLVLHPVIGGTVLLVHDAALGTAATIAIALGGGVALALALLQPVKGGIVAVLLKLDVWRDAVPADP